jgi:hypothetical protein
MCNDRRGSYPHSTANPAYDTISQKPIKVITSEVKQICFVPRLKKGRDQDFSRFWKSNNCLHPALTFSKREDYKFSLSDVWEAR